MATRIELSNPLPKGSEMYAQIGVNGMSLPKLFECSQDDDYNWRRDFLTEDLTDQGYLPKDGDVGELLVLFRVTNGLRVPIWSK